MAVESPAEIAGMPDVAGVEHRFVDLNGLRMHVAEAGDPAAEPVVMLHGWPQHWYEWRHLIGPLAERYRVICPDLRGLGWTDAPARGYEKENLATDVLALLDALDLDRVRLVGHDWGGWVGYLLCLREPERFERFVALNILPPFAEPDVRGLLSLWRFWYQVVIATPMVGERALRSLGDGNRVLRWIGGAGDAWTEAEREIFLGRLRDPARARASIQYYRAFQLRELLRIPFRYRDAHLRTPTRILFGTDDQVQNARSLEGIESRGDDLAYELFSGVGHFIADEIPEVVADRVLGFFSAAPSPSA